MEQCDRRGLAAGLEWRWWLIIWSVYFAVSAFDFLSPPISQTIWRQTQTAEITRNFVRGGFAFDALCIWTQGPRPVVVIYEFPLYNFIAGSLDWVFGHRPMFGKAISLMSGGWAMACVGILARRLAGWPSQEFAGAGVFAALIFALCPICGLINTAYQPDALGLAVLLTGIVCLVRVLDDGGVVRLLFGICCIALATMVKFPLLVPFTPALAYLGVRILKRSKTLAVVTCAAGIVTGIPILWWYHYREVPSFGLMDAQQLRDMFMFGDLSRFLRLTFYFKPAVVMVLLALGMFGMVPTLIGCIARPATALLAIAGVSLLFLVVPTAADQYYYLYPVMPMVSVIAGIGLARWFAMHSRRGRSSKFLPCACLVAWGAMSTMGWAYVLRQDHVTMRAGERLKDLTADEDLILFISGHDRVIGKGSFNPALSYFSGRRGWMLDPEPGEAAERVADFACRHGAKWILVTHFTQELELWYAAAVPRKWRNEPLHHLDDLCSLLGKRMEVTERSENWTVFRTACPD